ncbi:putative 5'(3')-deoxyribonucleotidase [Brevundimonas phage vB_BpoS-Kikimora]|uniref:5'(3')-deoxyribonucleotidase n=1 Tax=Brevundimonas phage vB_BpoS-Kikimora TaxID=2948601 RepID=A0A9E7MRJ6_9CAUD|nr:putative 5'(3')-deoxyribonucleotidase [Brevundimonas phage vB_BpoS-Kikimora]
MNILVVYLDLDGVMADYDAGIAGLGYHVDPSIKHDLNRSGTHHPLKREMYERIQGTQFYRNLPLLPGAVELYLEARDLAGGADPIILTAAPKFGATEDDFHLNPHWLGAAYHKRAWVETTLRRTALEEAGARRFEFISAEYRQPIADELFICTTSARKVQFMHRRPGERQVLVDDRIANVTAWAEAGGIGILHRDAETSIAALRRVAQWDGDTALEGFEPIYDVTRAGVTVGRLFTGA